MESFCGQVHRCPVHPVRFFRGNGVICFARAARVAATSSIACCLALAVGSTVACPITSAFADENSCDSVSVSVRTIEASGAVDSAATNDESAAPAIAAEIADLSSKLSRLPFRSFRLLAAKEEQLSLRKRDSFDLPNGQTLAFRPMYMDSKRVGLWISWKDNGGASILDTRIHFDADESVLTGTDRSPDSGTILAIKAAPGRSRSQQAPGTE